MTGAVRGGMNEVKGRHLYLPVKELLLDLDRDGMAGSWPNLDCSSYVCASILQAAAASCPAFREPKPQDYNKSS